MKSFRSSLACVTLTFIFSQTKMYRTNLHQTPCSSPDDVPFSCAPCSSPAPCPGLVSLLMGMMTSFSASTPARLLDIILLRVQGPIASHLSAFGKQAPSVKASRRRSSNGMCGDNVSEACTEQLGCRVRPLLRLCLISITELNCIQPQAETTKST